MVLKRIIAIAILCFFAGGSIIAELNETESQEDTESTITDAK